MKDNFFEKFRKIKTVSELAGKIKNSRNRKEKLFVSPLHGSSRALLIRMIAENEGSMLVLCPSVQSANEMNVELDILELGGRTLIIDKFDRETIQEKLTNITQKENVIIVASYDLLKYKLPDKNKIEKNTTKLQPGSELAYEELIEYLNLINYDKDKYVDEPGQFAVRGSIIDFWSFSESRPCRIEYDGDFLESIRYFDPESQRSSSRVNEVSLASSIEAEGDEFVSDIFDYMDIPLVLASDYELNDLFKDSSDQNDKISAVEIDEDLKEELYEGENGLPGSPEDETYPQMPENRNKNLEDLFQRNASWLIEDELGKYSDRITLGLTEVPQINSNFELLFNVLLNYARKNYGIIITAENELQSRRLHDLLYDFKPELKALLEKGVIKFEVLPVKGGFASKEEKLIVFTDYQLFNKPYRTKISSKQKYKKSRVKDFASIKKGDFVVHEYFGIGQYSGLENIKIGDVEQESIKILYAEGGVVYVNLNYLSLVKKYSSRENITPKLSVLGSNEWKNTKKKVKSKIKDAARDLITLYAKRKSTRGYSFSEDSIWQKELEASFFYEDTPDQSKVSTEVKEDMQSNNPMDRLVCGDVGFGKTEVAVRAAFKSVNDGKQVAMLVPTTILTEQHYNTFVDRLTPFPVKIEALSRFQPKKKQTEIVEELEKGSVDIVIGTHRLLSKDIKFKDLGLLIIDEEHRFGVMAKEKLRRIKMGVDTLTLTATPIPRTLNLSLLGARDLSIIATAPPNRQPIYTKVDKFDILHVREWILKEIKRNGQVYFVHDRVQSIDKLAAYVQKHIPEINIGIAHGQMRPSQLEKVIHDFLNKKFQVLFSTKIIESGLDIPNVNTIIVNRADRFGLAELHQLRGRVGRSDRQAYAYFLVPSLNTITKKAVRRLQAIEEYTDLGEGFNLSMRDLEIRGAGNLLGTEQSGAIDTVGFDLYVKLLDEAVEEIKQDEFKEIFKDLPVEAERTEPKIDTYFEIGIPKAFMPDQSDRLSYYSALFSILKADEINEIRDEMEDKFGKIPPIVERLMSAALLRYFASYALFDRVIIYSDRISLVFPKPDKEEYYKTKFTKVIQFVSDNYGKELYFKQTNKTMKLEMKNKFNSPEAVLKFLVRFLDEVMNLINKKAVIETGSESLN